MACAMISALLGLNVGKIEIGNSKFSVYADFGPEYTHDQKSENGIWTKSNNYIKDINEKTLSSSKTLDYTLMLKYKPTEKDYLAAYFRETTTARTLRRRAAERSLTLLTEIRAMTS